LILPTPHGLAAAFAVEQDEPGLVPPGVSALSLDAALAALHPDEREHAAALAPLRRRDWSAGRAALRAALAAAGLACDAAVLTDDRGAPVLPASAHGSVSHKRGLAVALAAAAGDARIGVDVERHGASRVDVSARILTGPELATLPSDPVERGRAVALRFSLKEAIYKAIDPFVRRYVGFREVAVWPEQGSIARVETLAPDLALEIESAWMIIGELVIATASARRRPGGRP